MGESRNKVYGYITDRIVAKLEEGTVPWHQPWSGGGVPKSLISKKPYRGVNVFVLNMMGYSSPWWLTWKQARKLGTGIKSDQQRKYTPCIYWNWFESKDADPSTGKKRKIPFMKYYKIWNVDQCEGVDPPKELEKKELEFNPIEEAEKIVTEYPAQPEILEGSNRASYSPKDDLIRMPKREAFENEEAFYSTLFHEMTHSTGHKSRLHRDTLHQMASFGSKDYSKEELVAEMGAAMLCGVSKIENKTIENSASYIESWIRVLKGDKEFAVNAASKAQKASDHILGISFESK